MLFAAPTHLWFPLMGYHAICFAGASHRQAWTFGRLDWRDGIWLGLALALLSLACLIPSVPDFPSEAIHRMLSRLPGGLPGQAIYAALINAPLEEAYWRGALLQEKRAWTPLQHGLAFGLHHGIAAAILLPWAWMLPAFLVPALAGAFWAWLARRNGGIAGAVATHMLSDLAILALVAHQMKAALS